MCYSGSPLATAIATADKRWTMSSTDMPTGDLTRPAAAQHRLLLPILTAAIFLSAALLFAVEPMFTKMVLPRLGGAPQVWSVAMVFFQAALLAGYGYAHALTRYAPGRNSLFIQLGVMVVACFFLPLSIASGWGKPPATGPLLQAWFARSDHPAAKDPYFLYAASNVGSFLALLSYPLIIEPLISLHDQTWIWTIGFYVLILLIAGTGYLLWNWLDDTPATAPSTSAPATQAPAPTWREALTWVCLAAVPSGLLIAVTAHISTDVAAVPLLWVIPLALYLLTFVIVFARWPIIPHFIVVALQPIFILALVALIVFDVSSLSPPSGATGIVGKSIAFIQSIAAFLASPFKSIIGQVGLHVAVFFVSALVCHGELARRRPPPRYLTAFYMWMSVGGMIGGIAAGLISPYVF